MKRESDWPTHWALAFAAARLFDGLIEVIEDHRLRGERYGDYSKDGIPLMKDVDIIGVQAREMAMNLRKGIDGCIEKAVRATFAVW